MDSAILYMPFNKVTAPGAVKVVEREVAHIIRDPLFGEYRFYKTHGHRRGFWETEPAKVDRLVAAFKAGHNIKNALFYAGITDDAYYRLLEAYPSFRGVIEACMASVTFMAMNTMQLGLQTNPDLAFKYIERRGDFNFSTDIKSFAKRLARLEKAVEKVLESNTKTVTTKKKKKVAYRKNDYFSINAKGQKVRKDGALLPSDFTMDDIPDQ